VEIKENQHWDCRRPQLLFWYVNSIKVYYYHSSLLGRVNHLPSAFGVHKGDSDQGAIVVTIPRELQGNSELVVFLGLHPVKSKKYHIIILIVHLSFFCVIEVSQAQRQKLIGYLDSLHGKHKCLPPWEQQLKIAQKVLFNHELFMQVCGYIYYWFVCVWECVCSYHEMLTIKRLLFRMRY